MSLCGAMGAGSRARGLFCHNAERLGFVLCVEATAGEPGGAPVLDGLGPSELRSRAWARDATLQSRGGGGRGHRHGRRREAPGIGVSGDHDPKASGGLGMGPKRLPFFGVVGSEASLDAERLSRGAGSPELGGHPGEPCPVPSAASAQPKKWL